MKHRKTNSLLSIAIIACLLITSTPLQAIAEEINESRQWQDIITTFEGDQNKNSLENAKATPGAVHNQLDKSGQNEKEFSLEAANEEFKTDRFIVKYSDDVKLNTIVDIPDLATDIQERKALEEISVSIEQNSKNETKQDKTEQLSKIQESIPVELDSTQLQLPETSIDTATVVESENIMVFETKKEMTGADFKDILKNKEVGQNVEYIQPDYELSMSSADPYFGDQWGHYQMYQPGTDKNSAEPDESGTKDPYRMDANILKAWEKTKGAGVIVALLDTGIETTHVDLQDNLLSGWDFVNNDDSVNDIEWQYDQWHGTHIAGIIAAEADNNIGVAGVAPESKILSLKVFQSGKAYTSDIIAAIKYAEMCGAKIANCSWGTFYDNPALKAAIENSSMVFVCAAGNGLYNTDKYPVYPASYDLDNVISVTSIDQDGKLSRFANYGKKSVDIAAPGRDIYSTTIDNGYAENSGTSMSAGYVSGALALLLSKDPGKTAENLKSRIVASGDKITGLMDKVKNGRKLNCGYALSINPLSNFNTIAVDDDEKLPEISPSVGVEQSQEYNIYAENTVSVKTPMPTARYGLGVAAVGNKIYAIGGQTATGCSIKVEEYNPRTDTWATKANMPAASSYFGIAKINDQIYVLGGYNGSSYLNSVQVYTPATDTWTTMPAAHNMPVAMKSFTATAYNGKIYVVGGFNGSYLNTIYEYAPSTGTWTQKQSLANSRTGHVAVEYGGKIYIDGGNYNWGNVRTGEVYDIAANQVTQNGSNVIINNNSTALNISEREVIIGGDNCNAVLHRSLSNPNYTIGGNMYYSRGSLGAAEVNGKVYVIGGQAPGGILSVVEEIDLGWESKGSLPAEMKNFTSVECNGKLYLFGGESLSDSVNVLRNTVYEYNPETSSWTQKADMPEYREKFALAQAYGKIYLIGGKKSVANTGTTTADNKVYEFDPVKNTWNGKTGFTSARYDLAAVNYNNLIYIAGGRDVSGNLVSNVEVFNPLDGTWQSKQNIPQASAGHFLTVSKSKLLLLGGTGGKVLEYNQSQNSWQVNNSSLNWTTYQYINSLANIYGNVFYFSSIIQGSRMPVIYKYDVASNKTANYPSFYLFNKAFSVTTLNNKVYTFDGPGNYASTMIEYRPSVTPWLDQNSNGVASCMMGTAVLGTDIYLIGGERGGYGDMYQVYKLNTQTNTWSEIQGLLSSRSDMAVGVLGTKICVCGGQADSRSSSSITELYVSNQDRWVYNGARPMPLPVYGSASIGYNGKLYVFGGTLYDGSYHNTPDNRIYTFDPGTSTRDWYWTTVGNLPSARYGCRVTLLSDGKMYIVGGYDSNNNPLSRVDVYDPVSRVWSTIPDMPEPLAYAGVAGTDCLYVVGGTNGTTTNGNVYQYSPATKKWSTWPGPGVALYGSAVAIVNNGIYVINGKDSNGTAYNMVKYLPLGGYNADYIHLGEEFINLSGNLARNYTDMNYTSQGFQINFSRTYNSRDDRTEGNIISKGWTFGFQGKLSSAGNDTLVRLPNGSGYTFRENTDGTFVAKDSRSTLVKQSDGSYIMTTKDLYSYGFNSSGYLTWMKDRNGNTISISVDSDGKINYITDPVGRRTNITYSSNRIWKITDFAGRIVQYSYDASGKLSSVTDPAGNITRYSYDSKGFLTGVKDHNENTIESFSYFDMPSYESLPRLKTVTDAMGKADTYQYDEGEGVVTITDNNGRQDKTWYDKMLYPIRTKDAEGKETHTEYNLSDGVNKYGEERVTVDRRGNAAYYDRDAYGNVIRKINPDGSIKEFSYDNKNNLISEKDELGKMTYYVYDGNKINLLKTARPINGTDVYSESASQSNFAIMANIYYTSSEAQTMCGKVISGLLKSVTDPMGNVTTYTYDVYGNKASSINALGRTAVYQYNTIGWLKQETSEKGYTTKYYYDRNGNVIKKIGHGGETERVVYDNMGHIIQNIKPNQYAAAGDAASAFDSNNVLTNTNTYSAADQGYRYVYYTNGQLKNETDPLNNTTGYTYDQYGNVLSKTYTNGYAEIYTYDVLNRAKSTGFQNSSSSAIAVTDEYSYNITAGGSFEKNRTHYFNSSYAPEKAVSKETYDYADRLVRTDHADGGYSVSEYMKNGNLSIATDPMGNKTYYSYDGLNRETGKWTTVSDGVCSYEGKEYDKNNNVIKVTASRNTSAPYTIPTSGMRYNTVTYDVIGRILGQGDSQGGKTTFTYDDTNDKVTQKQYASVSEYIETESLCNHLGKVKETSIKVNSADMKNGETVLKTSYTFDKEGNVLTETKPNNITTTHTYDLLGRKLTSSEPGTDDNGQATISAISCTYDFRGNILAEKDPLGRTTTYTYTTAGLLLKKTDAKGGVTYTERTPDNLLVAQISPKNYMDGAEPSQMTRTTYQYDVMGKALKENSLYKDKEGAFQTITKEYIYDKNGNQLTSKDGMGYVTSYTYDGQNRQLTVLDADGRDKGLSFTMKYSYDGLGQKTAAENGVHAVTSYTYNDQGKVLTAAVTRAITKTCTYDLLGNVLSESDGNGNTLAYTYNALGKIRTQTLPGDASIPSHVVSFQYTSTGDTANITDTLGKLTAYTYDNQHRLLSETESKSDSTNSITKSYRYDLAGNLRFSVDGNGNTTEFTYDTLNQKMIQKISVTINGTLKAQTTSYEYDADGKLTGTTDWLGNKYENIYDSLDRLICKKDPSHKAIEILTYDNNHRQIGSTDALGNVVTFAYDKANRLLSKTDASGNTESKTYDAAGNILTQTDGNGNVTTNQYDANNRLISVTNALSQITSYAYDNAGNILTQTDGGGNVTTCRYNTRNLPASRTDAGGTVSGGAIDAAKTESYKYYSDGKLSEKTDRNEIITKYTYDIHGRLLVENAGESIVSYTYDNNGNQLTMTDETGTTSRVYDEQNRVTSKIVPTIGTTSFMYDQAAELNPGYVSESYTDPKGNSVVRTKDNNGRLYQVKNGGSTTTYSYFDNGNLQKLEYPGGAAEEYTYYANNKLHTLVNKQGSSIIEAFSYEYDGAGNMTGKADRMGTTDYTYDPLNRLGAVTEPGQVTSYTFDAAGNRASETVTEGNTVTKTEYTYNEQNRLINTKKLVNGEETGGTDYSFDNNGNVLSTLPYTLVSSATTASALTIDISILGNEQSQSTTGTAIYEYDTRNQMIKAVSGKNTVESKYNGDGLRASKTVNGTTSNYLYEYDKIILETDGSNGEIAHNIYGTNLINRSVGSDSLYYLYNGHGDVTSLQTADGVAAAQYYYDAFGTQTEETGTANNPFRYAGYEFDGETDLYYLKSRMYDSVNARFMQEDTFRGQTSDPLSLNLYAYCNNNPIIYWDPDGHVVTKWDKKNLSKNQVKAVEKATKDYDTAKAKGDKAGMAAAHAAAEAARSDAHQKTGTVGSASGYTYKVSSNGSATLNKEDSAALAKATSSGSSTLNGSSYLPAQTIKNTNNVKGLNDRILADSPRQKIYIYEEYQTLTQNDPSLYESVNSFLDKYYHSQSDYLQAEQKAKMVLKGHEKDPNYKNELLIQTFKYYSKSHDIEQAIDLVTGMYGGVAGSEGKALVKELESILDDVVPQKVIGHYPEYIEMSSKLGTKPFSIPDNIWSKMTPAEQWTANQKFLDRAIEKGSEFNLATPIDKVRPGSYLEKEINYLIDQGYKLNKDGTKLVP